MGSCKLCVDFLSVTFRHASYESLFVHHGLEPIPTLFVFVSYVAERAPPLRRRRTHTRTDDVA